MPPKSYSPKAEQERDMLPQRLFFLKDDAAWGGFINIRLDEDDKTAFTEWWESSEHSPSLVLEELVSCGIKVTLAFDPENTAWLCSFTGRLVLDSDERFVTTTRAGSMSEVIALAVYKHVYVVRGVYKKYSNNNKPLWG